MTLRELYERAAELSATEDRNERLILQRLVYGCIPELLAVRDAARDLINWRTDISESVGLANLRAALLALKGKEEGL